MKSLVVDIQDGAVVCDAIGFTGGACEKATSIVAEELAEATVKRKPDFLKKPEHGQQAKARA